MRVDLDALAEDVRSALSLDLAAGAFDPVTRWDHLGILLERLEEDGCYLMTNSVADPELRRMASFHRMTDRGYPCVGASEWGRFERLGEAVLRAAHETLLQPRVQI